jgi:hypothetical protein
MPNSTIQASILMQILDGLGTTNQPLFSHQMPPVAYAGNTQASSAQNTSSAYLTIAPGNLITLLANPPVSPFLFVRNAGSQGVAGVEVSTDGTPPGPAMFILTPGGIFFYGNNVFSQVNGNYIATANIGVVGQVPVTIEYLFGV